jgi:methyl-accepting chemotaxis protein
MTQVSTMAGGISSDAEDVLGSSRSLSSVSETLGALVGKFKV